MSDLEVLVPMVISGSINFSSQFKLVSVVPTIMLEKKLAQLLCPFNPIGCQTLLSIAAEEAVVVLQDQIFRFLGGLGIPVFSHML